MNYKTTEAIEAAANQLEGIASLLVITESSLLPEAGGQPTSEVLLAAMENLEQQIRQVKANLEKVIESEPASATLEDSVKFVGEIDIDAIYKKH